MKPGTALAIASGGFAMAVALSAASSAQAHSDLMPFTLFFVPVRKWSDGTLAQYSH